MTDEVDVVTTEPTPTDVEVREAYVAAAEREEVPVPETATTEEKPRDDQGRFVAAAPPPKKEEPVPEPIPEPPDFSAEFDRFMRETQQRQWEQQQQQMLQAQRQQMAQAQPPMVSYQQPPPRGGLTLDDIVKDPDVVRRMAAEIAQQQTIPIAQAFQQLRSQMYASDHKKAAQHVQQTYSEYVKKEPAYKDPGVKQMADTAMQFAITQAYQTGNFDSLYNPLLPRMIMFMAKEAMGSQNKPSVRVRGADSTPRTTTQTGEKSLSPEQDALRRRLGLSVEQWLSNDKAGG